MNKKETQIPYHLKKKLCEKLSGTRLLLQSICQLTAKLVPKKPVQ